MPPSSVTILYASEIAEVPPIVEPMIQPVRAVCRFSGVSPASAAACFAAYAANREIGLMERRNVLGMVFAKSGGSSTGAPRNFSAPKGWFFHSSIVRMPQQPFRREAYSSSGELPRGEMTPMPVITHLRLFIKTYNPPF